MTIKEAILRSLDEIKVLSNSIEVRDAFFESLKEEENQKISRRTRLRMLASIA